jgi:uncharacterized RDD family membrane protein YckC
MDNNDKSFQINSYINDVSRLLPYSDSLKKEAIDELRIDVQTAMEDTDKDSPTKVFGEPLEVAKNICESQDWHKERATWLARFLAWFIDLIIKYFTIFAIMVSLFLFLVILIPYNDLLAEFSKWEADSYEITFVSIMLLIIISIITIISFSFMVAYNILLEGYFSTTIGKKLFNLVVVDHTGCKVTWKQAIIRNLSKIVTIDFVPMIIPMDTLIGIIIEKIDAEKANKQRGFDLLAETIVIKQPSKRGL